MKLKELMNQQVITIDKTATIIDAAKKMQEFDIGFLPVIFEKQVVGVLTDRDLVLRGLTNHDPKIESVMTKDLITIPSDCSIEEALILMRKQKIKRILVEEEKRLVGIISISDFLRKGIAKEELLETIESIYEISRTTDYYPTEIDEFYL